MMYKTLVLRLPDETTQQEYEALFKALAELNFYDVRYAMGDDIRNAKLLCFDESGKITGAQG